MHSGDVVGGRFELGKLTAAGGMGEVFQAKDLATGEIVALKVLIGGSESADKGRFEREAKVLAELRHPNIVRYIAHGETLSGAPYLAMEWLSGEPLADRLTRGQLTVDEAVGLGARVAEALAAAHARGLVHRDLKPSNLFLVDGDVGAVKVLDFGIALRADATRMTSTGALIGTPAYMAPEQARSGEPIDARTDVFALGCVLYECLTGRRTFTGEHVMAVLAKILFDDAPHLRDRCPEAPPALNTLLARMLAKDPMERPADGAAVAAALEALGVDAGGAGAEEEAAATTVSALTGDERRVLSVVLIGSTQILSLGTTQIDAGIASPTDAALRDMARARGGRFEPLTDGSAVVTIVSVGIPTDQAAQAARCALALRAVAPDRPMALATGRSKVRARLPAGDVIDRAAGLLMRGAADAIAGGGGLDAKPPTSIGIDTMTAGLLDSRFEVTDRDGGLELRGEREAVEGARTLLGKPTACFGRDRELGTLEAIFTECIEEPVARAVLVTAAAGVGKSRLAHELLRKIRRRGEAVEIWIGRGDSIRAGSAFSVLGEALRGACEIQDGEPLVERQEKLRARVARHVAPTERRRVAEFLGELVGTPLGDDPSVTLRTARLDSQLMGDQVRKAWEDFLRAETAAQPVLLVLEDLHWGDRPTVRLLGSALRELKERPFMVLALGRPEVHELFPNLWDARSLQEIRLGELTRRASERLVGQVLGQDATPATAARIAALADGNAFYLEELIRAVAEGRGEVLPETVLAMIEARLSGLEPEARRVLRAASVFGEISWQGGVIALLGSALRPATIVEWFSTLVDREVLVRRPESRFAGEPALAFRHALLREGAYSMLTEEDRALGHRLAAEWLLSSGESDPMVLAEHFDRGKEPARAASFFLRAAEQALWGNDTEGAIARARRGLLCSASDPALGTALTALLCEAHTWRNEWSIGAAYGDEVMRLAPPGSAAWAMAMRAKLGDTLMRGDLEGLSGALDTFLSVEPAAEATGPFALALATTTFLLDWGCRFELSARCRRRTAEIMPLIAERDPIARAWMSVGNAYREAWFREDPWAGLAAAEAGLRNFEEAEHPRGALMAKVAIGMSAWYLGAHARAEQVLRSTMGADEEFALSSALQVIFFTGVLADMGKFDEARRTPARLLQTDRVRGMPRQEGQARLSLSRARLLEGDLEGAEHEALAALSRETLMPLDRTAGTATLAAIYLAQGRAAEARKLAEEAMAQHEAQGSFGYHGAFARLIHAEALHATGDHEGARGAITAARDRLLARAARIEDAALRRSFLERVPENARTIELAEAWLG